MEKQVLKIKLNNHAKFQQAWAALIKAGYHWGGNSSEPCTAPYLYAYADGKILADFFDVEGADLSSTKSAAGYFAANDHKEIKLDELLELASLSVDEVNYQIQIDELDAEITELKEHIIGENHFSDDEEDQLEAMIAKAIQFGMFCAKRDALPEKS